ncbi:MAG: phosphate acyltransferase [Candidatus Binatota bacterium]|nr:phosphate acyltransferase [Candidatus Binatota bacterium]
MPTIAIDAMGGDHAPEEIVRGVAQVSRESDIQCILVGNEAVIQRHLEETSYRPEKLSIVHAPTAIGMAEDPREAIRAKKDCSLLVGTALVAAGRADAMVSAGNTGACVLACAKTFRVIRGIRKTALASVYPRKVEYPGQDPLALLLDVGATIRCQSDELAQFGIMGAAYAKRISKVPTPRVALLNMGSEANKGGDVLASAYELMQKLPGLNFVGNIEGNDLARGKADVIVCEGLLGNVVLKLIEGVSEVVLDLASYAAHQHLAWRLGLSMLASGIRQLRDLTDYRNYGGSPILGFENIFIKSHGRSNARAIGNAVKVAAKAVRDSVPAEIAASVALGR